MKKGFTIVEVSILFVIFLIVAFLVAPLSLDDTIQAKNISRWRSVQQEFSNMFYSLETQEGNEDITFENAFNTIINNEIKEDLASYKIEYMNGASPDKAYRFKNYSSTFSNAVISVKFFDEAQDDILGLLMYDVNGKKGPNTWGKDVFGMNIYNDKFEPLGKNLSIKEQKQDCSHHGTGLYCSNYYLIGGNFD